MNYQEYLQSPEWLMRRARAMLRAADHCQVCGSAYKLETHHNSYAHVGQERDDELIVLCDTCHELYRSRMQPLMPIWWDAELRDKIATEQNKVTPKPVMGRLLIDARNRGEI